MAGKTVEIDEQTAELGKLAHKLRLGKNGLKFLQLVKEEEPDLVIPELEQEARIEEKIKPLQEENAALRKRDEDRTRAESIATMRKPATDRGYTGDRLKALEQFMVDKKIGDYEVAIENFERAEEIAKPRVGGRTFDPPSLPADEEGLYKDPHRRALTVAHTMIDGFKQGKSA